MRMARQLRLAGLPRALATLVMLLPWPVAAETSGTVLWYLEQEAGGEPYQLRYIVTEQFLRSDEGRDEGGFVLLDRAQRRIYNVVPETGSVLTIDGAGPAPEAPDTLSIKVERSLDPQAPELEGRKPLTLELRADGELCRSAVVVPGLLDEASAALREFAQVLAVQQARTLANTPQEFQTPCFLARYLYAGDFHLSAGLPLLEWSGATERRELLKYEPDVPLDESLFVVPDELRFYQAPGGGASGTE